MTRFKFDLDAADLRISRGSVPASTQLAEALKAQIIQQRVPRGGRLPTERELMDRSGLSRVTVRAAVGVLESQGWVVRRQGLGTFVADPMRQELTSGCAHHYRGHAGLGYPTSGGCAVCRHRFRTTPDLRDHGSIGSAPPSGGVSALVTSPSRWSPRTYHRDWTKLSNRC